MHDLINELSIFVQMSDVEKQINVQGTLGTMNHYIHTQKINNFNKLLRDYDGVEMNQSNQVLRKFASFEKKNETRFDLSGLIYLTTKKYSTRS